MGSRPPAGQPPTDSGSLSGVRPAAEETVPVATAARPVTETDVPRPITRPLASTGPEDAALVAACRRGEQRAMEALYHQYKRRVFGLCHRIAGPGDAEEVAQDVFVRVFRGLASF